MSWYHPVRLRPLRRLSGEPGVAVAAKSSNYYTFSATISPPGSARTGPLLSAQKVTPCHPSNRIYHPLGLSGSVRGPHAIGSPDGTRSASMWGVGARVLFNGPPSSSSPSSTFERPCSNRRAAVGTRKLSRRPFGVAHIAMKLRWRVDVDGMGQGP